MKWRTIANTKADNVRFFNLRRRWTRRDSGSWITRGIISTGWHCSEGVLLAAGKYYFPEKITRSITRVNAFFRRHRRDKEEICGAFSGGLMVIGCIHGRTDPDINDDACMEIGKRIAGRGLLTILVDTICTTCGKIGSENRARRTARNWLRQAAGLLIEVLEKNKKRAG